MPRKMVYHLIRIRFVYFSKWENERKETQRNVEQYL